MSNLYEQFYFPSLCVFVSIIHLACATLSISLCATHIVPRPLFCCGYFYSTACTYDTNFAFPIPLHIPCFPFLAMIVVSIFPLNSTPPFLSHLAFVSLLYFVFIVIPFTTYSINFPFLFGLTCTTFLPFPYFIFMSPLINAALLMSTLHCLYLFYLSSTFYLLLLFL